MFCTDCGAKLEADGNFCAKCGAKAIGKPAGQPAISGLHVALLALLVVVGGGLVIARILGGDSRGTATSDRLQRRALLVPSAGQRLPSSDELAAIESLQAIVADAIARLPFPTQAVRAGEMDNFSRLYNYTLAAGRTVTMKDLMEGELYENLSRVFAGLDGFYGQKTTPETLYHFFGEGRRGQAVRRFYEQYKKDAKTFGASPVFPPAHDLDSVPVQKEIRRRLADGVDYDTSAGRYNVASRTLMNATIIRDQWRLTKDKIWTLPFEQLKTQIFENTPREMKGMFPVGATFPGLDEDDLMFYMALGADTTALSMRRDYETWRTRSSGP